MLRFAVVMLFLVVVAPASGATLVVTSTADTGGGSLRATIAAAGPGDVVNVPVKPSHYMVTSAEIQITKAITIQGTGSGLPVIDAAGHNRVFEITGTVPASATVFFKNVAITGGATAVMPGGGAILVDQGSLELDGDAITGNRANLSPGATPSAGGGGVYNNGGATTLRNTNLSGNSTTIGGTTACCHGGGGLYGNAGAISVTGGNVSGNSASVSGSPADAGSCCSGGGGIYQDAAFTTTITGVALRNNTAAVQVGDCCHGGGAIFIDENPAAVTISGSALTGNQASVSGLPTSTNRHCCHGGGAIASFAQLNIDASSLTANRTTVSAGGCCHGGGAVQEDSNDSVALSRSNVSGNASSIAGIGCCNGGGAVQLDTGNGAGFTAVASAITGNTSNFSGSPGTESGGGGVYEDSNKGSSYVNSTVANNSTNATNPASSMGGGGIFAFISSGSHDGFFSSTVAGNSATAGSGGGILLNKSAGQFKNSIVALNHAGAGKDCAISGVGASSTSLGHNLEDSPDTCAFSAAVADRVVAASLVGLGPLGFYGGGTPTVPLLFGSRAINGGANCTDPSGALLTTDQRGFPRTRGGLCDIGAFEGRAPHAGKAKLKGKARVGKRLMCVASGFSGDGPFHYRYKWMRGKKAIKHAKRSSYKVRMRDLKHRLSCQISAATPFGSTATAKSKSKRVRR